MQTLRWFSVSCVVLFLLTLFVPSPHAKAKTINLTYCNFFPPTHIHATTGAQWAKQIEKRTIGAVKITYYPGGVLFKGDGIWDGILKGVTDIGMSCFAYMRGRFPAMEALDLPLGYPNGYVATMTANDFLNAYMPKELDQLKVLYLHAHGPGLLHTKIPVSKLEDVRSLKVRATGLSAKVAKALGCAPVGMPQGSTYEALQKGVVEGTFSPMEVLKFWNQAEVVDYTTLCYSIGYTTAMYVMMNKAKWESLPKEVQQVFEEVSLETIPKQAAAWDYIYNESRKFALSAGHKMTLLSEEEGQRWVSAVQPVIDGYLAMANKKGLPGEEYVKFIQDSIKKYSNKVQVSGIKPTGFGD